MWTHQYVIAYATWVKTHQTFLVSIHFFTIHFKHAWDFDLDDGKQLVNTCTEKLWFN